MVQPIEMKTWLFKWLDARLESGVDIAGASVEFRGSLGWGGWIFWMIVLTAVIYFSYRFSPPHLSKARRFLLTSLRSVFLGALLLLLLRPVLAFTVEGSVRRLLVVLCDNSASLRIPDPRITAEDQARAAIARNLLDPSGGVKQSLSSSDAQTVSRLPRLDLCSAIKIVK